MTLPMVQREPIPGKSLKRVVVTDAGLAAIERMAGNGASDVTIARTLGIHPETFRKLRDDEDDDRVLIAHQAGKGKLADELTDILLTHAREGSITAAIYLSKARLGWRDQGPTPQAVNPTQINISVPAPMSDAEFKKLITVKKGTTDDHED